MPATTKLKSTTEKSVPKKNEKKNKKNKNQQRLSIFLFPKPTKFNMVNNFSV